MELQTCNTGITDRYLTAAGLALRDRTLAVEIAPPNTYGDVPVQCRGCGHTTSGPGVPDGDAGRNQVARESARSKAQSHAAQCTAVPVASVHFHMPADGTRTADEDRQLEQMRRQTTDRQAVYPPGRYTIELELDCPASAVPELKEGVTYRGDRAVTVIGPLDITLMGSGLDHTQLAQQVVIDVLAGLFGWDFDGQPCKVVRFGAVPGHLARTTDTVPTPAVYHGKPWTCGCGRTNANDAETCTRCGAPWGSTS